MKVRWNQDSIRLRITPTEWEAVQRGESVQETLAFPGGIFWTLTLRPGVAETTLASDAQGVSLSLSQADRETLAQPETEGIYRLWESPEPVRYCVEKDFPCAHPRAGEAREPETKTFVAPPGFEERKSESDPRTSGPS